LKLKQFLQSRYSKFGNRFIVTPDYELLCFSDSHDDLVTKFVFPISVTKPIFVDLDDVGHENERIDSIIDDFNRLSTQTPVIEFPLVRKTLESLHDTIKLVDSTHIRFFTRDKSIFVRVFDYRKYLYEVSFNGSGYNETVLSGQKPTVDFSFTIDSKSFSKLMKENYQVEVLRNGIVGFVSVDSNSEFYFRDQDVIEPILEFQHETLKKSVSICLKSI